MGAGPDGSLPRREFLQRGAAATLGMCALGLAEGDAAPPPDEPRVRRRVTLGRTGLEIPDISLGSGATADADVFRYAYDRGITYFDTAESYPMYLEGRAETALGEALRGVRDRVVIASKVVAGPRARRGDLMKALEGSLRRLETDRIDVYFNHAVNNLRRLRNPEWFAFVEQAKQQGKIRFSGMSGHGGRLIECLDHALDHDLVDVVLVAYNFGQDPRFYEKLIRDFDVVALQPDLPRVLAKAQKKGVGVLVMKTLMGARLNDMRPYEWGGATFAQAAFRWVLSDPKVHGLVVSMKSREHVDEYLGASGARAVRRRDLRLLAHYLERNSSSHCRQGCDACESSCPDGVPVSDVLRARMYAVDYGEPELARREYARHAPGADACLRCADPRCLAACPYRLDVPELTRETARLLSAPASARSASGSG